MHAPRAYFRASGAFLAALALAGAAFRAMGERAPLGPYLAFDPAHDVLHAVLAALALGLGFAPLGERALRRSAMAIGTAYLALAALGSISGDLFGFPRRLGLAFHMEIIENIAHLALGAWGAYVGTYEKA